MRHARFFAFVCLALAAPSPASARPHRKHPPPAQVLAANEALIAAIARQPGEPAWRSIVLHHTAAETDSLASIDALHGKRFSDPQGTQYHFLVGNGHAAADGAIQPARWRYRTPCIHVAHPERAPMAITVSVQGNLHERAPTAAQMVAVESLVRRLMQVYAIPADRVSTNTRVDGTVTVCPGKFFPDDRLLHRLRTAAAVTAADWRDPFAAVPLDGPYADLDAARAALHWDRPCNEPIPVGPWQMLKTLRRDDDREARLLKLDGGRGCTPIVRRFVALRVAAAWYLRELNGYREARLKPVARKVGGAWQVADERGAMLMSAMRAGQDIPAERPLERLRPE